MLTGELVTLRPVRPEDVPSLYEWRVDVPTWLQQDPAPPYPMTLAEFRAVYDKITAERDNTEWAIEANDDGALVGRCGIFSFDWTSRHAEIGITVGVPFRGRGYGTDAVRLLLDYGFRFRNLHKVHLETLASNAAGVAAYEKAGFVTEGVRRQHAWVDGHYEDVLVMGVLRSEWAGRG